MKFRESRFLSALPIDEHGHGYVICTEKPYYVFRIQKFRRIEEEYEWGMQTKNYLWVNVPGYRIYLIEAGTFQEEYEQGEDIRIILVEAANWYAESGSRKNRRFINK